MRRVTQGRRSRCQGSRWSSASGHCWSSRSMSYRRSGWAACSSSRSRWRWPRRCCRRCLRCSDGASTSAVCGAAARGTGGRRAGVPGAALAWQARDLESELPRGKWLPAGMESARGVDDLDRMHRSGVINTIRVLLELPTGQSALEPAGWAAIRNLSSTIAADPRVAHVQSLPGALLSEEPNPVLLSLVPDAARRSMISADERVALLDVVPHDSVNFNALSGLARDLRALDATTTTGVTGAAIHVGGLPAFNADYVDVIN